MPKWPTKPLGELCQLINGRAFKPGDWGKDGLRIVRIQNLNDHEKPFNFYSGEYRDVHLIDDGAILLSWSGTPGTSFGCFRWSRGPGLLNQHIFKVLVDESAIDGDFFIHAVNSKLEEMIGQAHGGVGLRHITKGKLEAIQLPVPSLDEQRRIVDRINECLGRVDEIETLRIEALCEAEYLAPSLYAAIESENQCPRMKLSDVILSSRNGRSIKQENGKGNGSVLTLTAVRDITLDCDASKSVSFPDDVATQFRISEGDVFVSRSNTRELVGIAAVAPNTPIGRVIYPDLLIKLVPNPEFVRPRFLAYALRTSESRWQIKERALGSSQTMVKISGERLKEVEIPVPPLDSQDELIAKFDELHDLSASLVAEMESIDVRHLRESILRKAFAGEL